MHAYVLEIFYLIAASFLASFFSVFVSFLPYCRFRFFCTKDPLSFQFFGCYIVSIQFLSTYMLYFSQSMYSAEKYYKRGQKVNSNRDTVGRSVVAIFDSFSVNRNTTVYLFFCSIFFIFFSSYHLLSEGRKETSYGEKLYSIFHKHQQFIIFLIFFKESVQVLHSTLFTCLIGGKEKTQTLLFSEENDYFYLNMYTLIKKWVGL